jgi:hypothetical protein
MWQIKIDFPSIGTYDAALEHFKSVEPYKGDDLKPMGSRRTRTKTMRQGREGEIIFRLYSHDCVTYHKDGRVTINPYDTVSTRSFIYQLLPVGLHLMWDKGAHYVYAHTSDTRLAWGWDYNETAHQYKRTRAQRSCQRLWHVVGEATFKQTGEFWECVEGAEKFVYHKLDRVKTAKVLKEAKYHDFAAFVTAYVGLHPENDGDFQSKPRPWYRTDLPRNPLEAFEKGFDDRQEWIDLVYEYTSVQSCLRYIRDELYADRNVCTLIERDFVYMHELATIQRTEAAHG